MEIKYKKYNCLNCNQERIQGRNSYGKYCGPKCHNEHKSNSYIERWLRGEEDGNRKGLFRDSLSNTVRNYLIRTRGAKCELCGWDKINPITGLVPIQIDHIDGNHKNSVINNLRILCPNCHTLTPFYGSLNKGRGREGKLEHYRKHANQSKTNACIDCKEPIYPISIRCWQCNKKISSEKLRTSERRTEPKINWPPTEVLVAELKTKSCLQLAKELGVSNTAIKKHFRQRGLHFPTTRIEWPPVVELIEALKNNTCKNVAVKLGVHSKTLRDHIKKYGPK